MSGLIKRQDVVELFAQDWNADVTERIGHNWRRLNAMVADQGDAEIDSPGFDFFFLEVYAAGSHKVRYEGEFQTGDIWEGQCQTGSFSFVQGGAPFRGSAEGHGKVLQTYFDRSIFTDCAASIFKADPDRATMRGFHGVFDPTLKNLADALLEEARRPNIGSDLNADLIAQQIAVALLRNQNDGKIKELRDQKLSGPKLAHVISYLDDQIEDIGGMDTVAALIDMDVYSFTRAFKLTTGQTPGQFLIERRLSRVKDLLLSTNDTLADITYATGFANQAHMTSTFTKRIGTSPGKWRKAVRA